MQRIWLREGPLHFVEVDVECLPAGQQLRAGGAEAGMVDLEHVEDLLALFLVHMNRI